MRQRVAARTKYEHRVLRKSIAVISKAGVESAFLRGDARYADAEVQYVRPRPLGGQCTLHSARYRAFRT